MPDGGRGPQSLEDFFRLFVADACPLRSILGISETSLVGLTQIKKQSLGMIIMAAANVVYDLLKKDPDRSSGVLRPAVQLLGYTERINE